MKEYEAGVTTPPFHPWCRSVTVPWFEDNFTGERAARGEDGKTYYVSDSMTYPEWKNKCVENSSGYDKIKLTDEEHGALNKYISFDSYLINDILRREGYDSLSNTQKIIVDNLDSALKKMPTYQGDVSRSLHFSDDESIQKFVSKFKIGDSIVFEEYISTTNAMELYNPDGQIQIFIMDAKKGRDITKFNNLESEVLYERSSKFNVQNIHYEYDKYWILLEEYNE